MNIQTACVIGAIAGVLFAMAVRIIRNQKEIKRSIRVAIAADRLQRRVEQIER